MTLFEAQECKEYKISKINVEDADLESYLFTLGCYSGEPITVLNKKGSNRTVVLKDARYSFDSEISKSIEIE